MDKETMHAIEVKIKALEFAVLCLLKIQDDEIKQDLRASADRILIQFSSERPGVPDALADYHRELASTFADLVRRGTSEDGPEEIISSIM